MNGGNKLNYVLIGIYLMLSVGGLALFKLGSEKAFVISVSNGIFDFKISFLSIMGLLSYICSFLIYMFLISKMDMTYIVPISTGITQVLTFILAVLVFKETLTISKVGGTILILIGVVVINLKK